MTIEWTPILHGLGWVVLYVLAELVFGILGPLFRPLRRIFRPPHGAPVLALIWLSAGAALFAGFPHLGTGKWWTLVAVIGAPIVALVATGAYRDERRIARHLPAAAPANQALSSIGRVLSGILGVTFMITGVFMPWATGLWEISEIWPEAVLAFGGMFAFGGLLIYAAVKGRFPARII